MGDKSVISAYLGPLPSPPKWESREAVVEYLRGEFRDWLFSLNTLASAGVPFEPMLMMDLGCVAEAAAQYLEEPRPQRFDCETFNYVEELARSVVEMHRKLEDGEGETLTTFKSTDNLAGELNRELFPLFCKALAQGAEGLGEEWASPWDREQERRVVACEALAEGDE